MMRQVLDVFVPGAAKTKGSIDAIARKGGRTYVRQNVKGSTRWAQLVEYRLREVWGDRPRRDGVPIRATLTYWLPLTEEHLTAQGSGDVDKLERNILDAITKAGVYGDDAQVVGVVHEKKACIGNAGEWLHPQGVQIVLFEEVAA